jgi:hypothetical protein
MKSLLITVATIVAGLGLILLANDARAAQSAPPPGSAEETIQGSVTVCFQPGTTTPESCSDSGVTTAVVSFLEVGQVTWDVNGNACASGVETISVPGSAVAITQHANLVAKLVNYDAATHSGDGTGTGYSGGKCVGASFDSSGATVRSDAAFHFVISQNGKRLDSILTSLSVTDQQVGAFSLSGTAFRQ